MELDEIAYSGEWWEIARYGGDSSFFNCSESVKWIFTRKQCSYYALERIATTSDPDDGTKIYTADYGYAVVSNCNKIKIIIGKADQVCELGDYNIVYTDYNELNIVARTGEVIVFSRYAAFPRSRVKLVMTLLERAGYQPQDLKVRSDSIVDDRVAGACLTTKKPRVAKGAVCMRPTRVFTTEPKIALQEETYMPSNVAIIPSFSKQETVVNNPQKPVVVNTSPNMRIPVGKKSIANMNYNNADQMLENNVVVNKIANKNFNVPIPVSTTAKQKSLGNMDYNSEGGVGPILKKEIVHPYDMENDNFFEEPENTSESDLVSIDNFDNRTNTPITSSFSPKTSNSASSFSQRPQSQLSVPANSSFPTTQRPQSKLLVQSAASNVSRPSYSSFSSSKTPESDLLVPSRSSGQIPPSQLSVPSTSYLPNQARSSAGMVSNKPRTPSNYERIPSFNKKSLLVSSAHHDPSPSNYMDSEDSDDDSLI